MTSTFLIINDELCLVKHNKFSIETSNILTLIIINMKDKNVKTKNFIHCRLINEMIYLSKLFVLDQRSKKWIKFWDWMQIQFYVNQITFNTIHFGNIVHTRILPSLKCSKIHHMIWVRIFSKLWFAEINISLVISCKGNMTFFLNLWNFQ